MPKMRSPASLSLVVEKELKDFFSEKATERNMSVNEYINRILENYSSVYESAEGEGIEKWLYKEVSKDLVSGTLQKIVLKLEEKHVKELNLSKQEVDSNV